MLSLKTDNNTVDICDAVLPLTALYALWTDAHAHVTSLARGLHRGARARNGCARRNNKRHASRPQVRLAVTMYGFGLKVIVAVYTVIPISHGGLASLLTHTMAVVWSHCHRLGH